MGEVSEFGRVVLVVSIGFVAALLSTRIGERLRVPAPALFLAFSAIATSIFPALGRVLSITDVERIGAVALILILFDGGMQIGWSRFRRELLPISILGFAGTFLTALVMAGLVHYAIGLSWEQSLLVAGALAPTDPAVMFSVLGGRAISERISVILQGESGANDPVGIAVVLGLIEVDRHQAGVGAMVLHVALGLAIGAAVGIAGGLLMRRVMARPTLAADSLYPLRSLAGAGVIYGAASVLDGSGFLAVFIAGMLVAEAEATRGQDIELVHQVLASLGEIVVFVALGLTIHLDSLGFRSVWVDGVIVSVMLVVIARPLVVAALLTPLRYPGREQAFIAWAGLRGAVPILLAAFTLIEGLPGAHRIYGIVFVVVLVTVLVQGSLLPWVAERCSVAEPATVD
jgi:potassium/hydrogen antiporter